MQNISVTLGNGVWCFTQRICVALPDLELCSRIADTYSHTQQ